MNFSDERLSSWFWDRVIPVPFAGCWLWLGGTNEGYGVIHPSKATEVKKTHYAHRLFYMRLVGEIPTGKELDHLCRVTCCVNPLHLEPVTHKINILRGAAGDRSVIGQRESAKTHCKQGHEYTPENTELRTRKRRNRKGTKEGRLTTRHCRLCIKTWRKVSGVRERQLRSQGRLAQKY